MKWYRRTVHKRIEIRGISCLHSYEPLTPLAWKQNLQLSSWWDFLLKDRHLGLSLGAVSRLRADTPTSAGSSIVAYMFLYVPVLVRAPLIPESMACTIWASFLNKTKLPLVSLCQSCSVAAQQLWLFIDAACWLQTFRSIMW